MRSAYGLLTGALGGCAVAIGCSGNPTPPSNPSNVTVARQGETTVVTIEDREKEPENAVCKQYCDRLAACWYAVPNADPMLGAEDVRARCRKEQTDCRTPTTEVLCCGSVSACGDFVHCRDAARDVVSDCSHTSQGRASP